MKGKTKWIILIAIVVVIIVAVSLIIINNAKYNYEVEEVKEFNYSILQVEEKYGVIYKDGTVVIEPTYDSIQIPNPEKPVFVCMSDYNTELREYSTKILNNKSEQLYSEYENVQAIPTETTLDGIPYEKSVLQYRKDGKYGLISLEGKKITDPLYEEISSINYKEGTLLVKQGDKVGAINIKGTTIIKPEYETITSDNYYHQEKNSKYTGFIVSKKTENGFRYGYINARGKTILEAKYTELERVTEIEEEKEVYLVAFLNGQAGLLKNGQVILEHQYEDIEYNSVNEVFVVQRNGKQGVVSKEGKTIVGIEYDDILFGGIYIDAKKEENITVFDMQGNQIEDSNIISMTKTENPNYYIAIDRNDIYTIADAQGKTIIDNNYSYIEYLPGDYFIVALDGKNGIIDISGKSVVDLKYTSIYKLNDTELIQAEINETKTIDLYNKEMKNIASMEDATLHAEENYILLSSKKEFEYYTLQGQKVTAKELFPNNTLFAKEINGKWGFVDVNGKVIVQNDYDMVTDFNENGFAGIKKAEKWGVINKEGTVIQEPIYTIEWNQPEFIGKYYKLNSWNGDARYSSDAKEKEEAN